MKGLWTSNAVSVLLVAINTYAWGMVIRAFGPLQVQVGYLVRMGLDPFFLLALATGFLGIFATYQGMEKLGIAKSAFFYHTGTLTLLLTSHFALGETFSLLQIGGIIAIGIGVVLVGTVKDR